MTEQTTKLRRSTTLPTSLSLDMLVTWAHEGPLAMTRYPAGARAEYRRARALVHLRRLASTLGTPDKLNSELRAAYARDFGALSDALLSHLARQARLGGYVTAGCRSRVPLTPTQAHTLSRLSWGATFENIARDEGCMATSVAETVARARQDNGCSTTAQLMACAFRNHWLPDQEEMTVLLSGRMVWDPSRPGYDRPPYKGIVE